MDKIISKRLAIIARSIGFEEWCDKSYVQNCATPVSIPCRNSQTEHLKWVSPVSAPTQTMLSKWLRDNHDLYCHVDCNSCGWFWELKETNGTSINLSSIEDDPNDGCCWDSYEEAHEECLVQACEFIKHEK